jgi:hypothetical protein
VLKRAERPTPPQLPGGPLTLPRLSPATVDTAQKKALGVGSAEGVGDGTGDADAAPVAATPKHGNGAPIW